jgi:phosphoribosylanthranilate isomerase
VKICGITRVADAVYAERAGADAIGVVVASPSPRSVTLEDATAIFDAVGPFTTTVAVTHTTSFGELEEILSLNPCGIQISHPFEVPDSYGGRVMRMIGREDPLKGDCDAYALDESWGTAKLFDPEIARRIVHTSPVPVILCGGLTPANVAWAIREVRPYAVDVCSGVEISPGIKDHQLIQQFIDTANKKKEALKEDLR